VRTRPAPPPPVEALDALPAGAFAAALAPLFEGAPRFLGRLAEERPFGTYAELFGRANAVALAMPEDEQIELIDAHPRLGAPPADVSALSFREQGYGRAETAPARVARELERLNRAYEDRFGFRFCVFVAGRPPEDLLPVIQAALGADRASEVRRALTDVVAIAMDRYARLSGTQAPAG
jgi:2-oxo-4-hydroxy-4-carboxy-5-ureidoimidazoline decarboxylase